MAASHQPPRAAAHVHSRSSCPQRLVVKSRVTSALALCAPRSPSSSVTRALGILTPHACALAITGASRPSVKEYVVLIRIFIGDLVLMLARRALREEGGCFVWKADNGSLRRWGDLGISLRISKRHSSVGLRR